MVLKLLNIGIPWDVIHEMDEDEILIFLATNGAIEEKQNQDG